MCSGPAHSHRCLLCYQITRKSKREKKKKTIPVSDKRSWPRSHHLYQLCKLNKSIRFSERNPSVACDIGPELNCAMHRNDMHSAEQLLIIIYFIYFFMFCFVLCLCEFKFGRNWMLFAAQKNSTLGNCFKFRQTNKSLLWTHRNLKLKILDMYNLQGMRLTCLTEDTG